VTARKVRPWRPWEKAVLAVAWAVVLWGVVLTVRYCMVPGEVHQHLVNVAAYGKNGAIVTSNVLLWRFGRRIIGEFCALIPVEGDEA
jgi:hypothetical protein